MILNFFVIGDIFVAKDQNTIHVFHRHKKNRLVYRVTYFLPFKSYLIKVAYDHLPFIARVKMYEKYQVPKDTVELPSDEDWDNLVPIEDEMGTKRFTNPKNPLNIIY